VGLSSTYRLHDNTPLNKTGFGVLLDLSTGVKLKPGLYISSPSLSVLSVLTVSSYACIYWGEGGSLTTYDLRHQRQGLHKRGKGTSMTYD
jgi:hypothetical protein